ncbi:MAG: hypothetical protein HQK76_17475 [Desulfobacterales bacterium]|nr:hypothetical protein [Desulfobacterales bacterium]
MKKITKPNKSNYFKQATVIILPIIILIGFSYYIISSWFNAGSNLVPIDNIEKTNQQEYPDTDSFDDITHESVRLDQIESTPLIEKKTKETDNLDPRLKGIKIKEIPVESETNDIDPKEKKKRQIISTMSTPMESNLKNLSSFIYEGEMKMTIPRLNQDKSSFESGQRYEAGIEVKSKFTFTKDENGNYHIYQRTQSEKGDSKFDAKEYNGDIYYVDGNPVFVDSNGNIADDSQSSSIFFAMKKSNHEPLVRQNWLQILNDISPGIGFETIFEGSYQQNYGIKPENKKQDGQTISVKKISGDITISNGNMTNASIEGIGEVERGFMAGSTVNYSIELKVYDIGKVPRITTPF